MPPASGPSRAVQSHHTQRRAGLLHAGQPRSTAAARRPGNCLVTAHGNGASAPSITPRDQKLLPARALLAAVASLVQRRMQ